MLGMRVTKCLGWICWLGLTLPALASQPSARELLAAGRADEAIRKANARLQESPADAEAYNLLCRTYFALEKWDKAIPACERAVALVPSSSEYHMWLGRAYGEKAGHSSFLGATGWAKKARQQFERAVELDAFNVAARSDLTEFYIDAPSFLGGGTGKARNYADQIAQQNAALAHFLKSRIAEKEKDYSTAETELRAAIAVSDDPAGYWLNLASFYERRKRRAEMEQAVNQALAANRKKTNVLFAAAEILFRAGGSLPAAADLVRQYLTGTPEEEAPAFQAHYLLGNILEKQGKNEEAAREYQAALAMAGDFDKARERLNRAGH